MEDVGDTVFLTGLEPLQHGCIPGKPFQFFTLEGLNRSLRNHQGSGDHSRRSRTFNVCVMLGSGW